MLVLRRHVALWRCLHLWLFVWYFEPNQARTPQPAWPSGFSFSDICHLLHMAVVQRTNFGHENLAHPSLGQIGATSISRARAVAVLAQLGLGFAAHGLHCTLQFTCYRSCSLGRWMGRDLGHFEQVSIA